MTFLAPASGLVAAGVAVPLLLALYFLKLRRREVRISTTMLWESAIKDLEANVPLRWLRWSWLLALQLLALVCVLIALARPAIPGVSGGASRVTILIDRSASMSMNDGVPDPASPGRRASRLDQAKREARAVIAELKRSGASSDGRRPSASVIAYASHAQTMCGFTSSQGELLAAIDSIDASDQPDTLERALELARAPDSGVASETEVTSGRLVVVITDRDLSEDQLRPSLPRGAGLRVVRVGDSATPPDNLGIVAVSALRDSSSPSTVRVFVRLLNAGPAAAEAAISCRVNDRPVGVRTISVPAQVGRTPTASVLESGEPVSSEIGTSVTFEFNEPSAGLVVVSINRPDMLASDNQASLVLRAASKPRVLVVGPGPGGGQGADAKDTLAAARGEQGVDRFLLGALRSLDLAKLSVVGSSAGSITESVYDLIVFDRVTPVRAPGVPTLSIGAGIANVQVIPVQDSAADVGDQRRSLSTRVSLWNRIHPVLRNSPLDSLLIAPPMRLVLPDRVDASNYEVLAEGAHGLLMALIDGDSPGRPRRLVLGFDLIRTNWGPDLSFPVFIASAVEFLTGRGDALAGAHHTTSQTIALVPQPGSRRIGIDGHRTLSVPVPLESTDERDSISVGPLDRAGVYRVEGAAGVTTLAVNVESAQETLAGRTQGTAATAPTNSVSSASVAELNAATSPAPQDWREIWHWFIALAGVLSSIEWIVYALRSRV